LKGSQSSYLLQPKKGGVIEKIHRLSFDLRIFRHYDRRIVISIDYPIPQSTGSNSQGGHPGIRHQDPEKMVS
jgi:hypothetical protein